MEEKKTENQQTNQNFGKPVAGVAINVAIIFGVPAFLVAFLSDKYEWPGERTALFMVLAFFFSWAIMITRFKVLTSKFEKIANQEKNKELKDDAQ